MGMVVFVIMYNTDFNSSKTILELSTCEFKFSKIVVVNNGPVSLNIEKLKSLFYGKSFEVEYLEYLENLPLSKLYNLLIEKYNYFTKYCFLDHDSDIGNFFTADIVNSVSIESHLILPSIISNVDGVSYYPLVNGSVDPDNKNKFYSQQDIVFSIGSGLILDISLIGLVSKSFGSVFDERFALYGVDVSLFKRINILKDRDVSISIFKSGYIKHDLSRVSEVPSKFRSRERTIDSVLSMIHYSPGVLVSIKYILKTILINLKCFDIKMVLTILYVILKRKHPRC